MGLEAPIAAGDIPDFPEDGAPGALEGNSILDPMPGLSRQADADAAMHRPHADIDGGGSCVD